MTDYWGPATWLFLHTLSYKIKEEHFLEVRSDMIKCFGIICNCLPCPDCQAHAKSFTKTFNFNKIQTRNDFIVLLWDFHNSVNKKKLRRSSIVPLPYTKIYEKAIFKNVCQNFYVKFSKPLHNQRLFFDSLGRTNTIKFIQEFIKNNQDKFNP